MKRIGYLVLAICASISMHAWGLDKPVIYYSFENLKGDTVADLSGNGNEGRQEGGPKVVDSPLGKGLHFEGTRVTFPVSKSFHGNLFQDTFTLVVWMKPTLKANTWQQVFRSIRADRTNDTLFVNNDGRLSWRGHVKAVWAGGMCETDPGVTSADKWAHVAVTGDKKNFRIYVNGALSKESAFQTTDGENVTFFLGGQAGGESYTGSEDEFAVFTSVLKDAEIKSLMDKGVGQALAVQAQSKLTATWAGMRVAR